MVTTTGSFTYDSPQKVLLSLRRRHLFLFPRTCKDHESEELVDVPANKLLQDSFRSGLSCCDHREVCNHD